MTNPTIHAGAPWRVLVLDRSDVDDPKWLLCTVTLADDVRPAQLDEVGRYTDWYEVTEWVRESLGRDVSLVPLAGAKAWHVDGEGPR